MPGFRSMLKRFKLRFCQFNFLKITLSVVHLLRVQADQPGNKNCEVHLPAYRFEDSQSPCRVARRDDVAVTERRDRHEAEYR